jgi:hypothetical protein
VSEEGPPPAQVRLPPGRVRPRHGLASPPGRLLRGSLQRQGGHQRRHRRGRQRRLRGFALGERRLGHLRGRGVPERLTSERDLQEGERLGPKEAADGARALRARRFARADVARRRRQEDRPLPGVREVRPGARGFGRGARSAARNTARFSWARPPRYRGGWRAAVDRVVGEVIRAKPLIQSAAKGPGQRGRRGPSCLYSPTS